MAWARVPNFLKAEVTDRHARVLLAAAVVATTGAQLAGLLGRNGSDLWHHIVWLHVILLSCRGTGWQHILRGGCYGLMAAFAMGPFEGRLLPLKLVMTVVVAVLLLTDAFVFPAKPLLPSGPAALARRDPDLVFLREHLRPGRLRFLPPEASNLLQQGVWPLLPALAGLLWVGRLAVIMFATGWPIGITLGGTLTALVLLLLGSGLVFDFVDAHVRVDGQRPLFWVRGWMIFENPLWFLPPNWTRRIGLFR